MTDKTRTCPECGGQMVYRLGEFVCRQCSATAPAAAEEPAQRSSRPAQSAAQWDPGAQYRNNPPAAPSAPLLGAVSYGEPEGAAGDPLAGEKRMFLIATAVSVLLGAALSWGALIGMPEVDSLGAGFLIVILVVTVLFMVGVYALVFFTEMVWLKWTCLGCNGCGMLSGLAGLLGMGAAMQGGMEQPVASQLLSLAVGAWLISILWRDIQRS